MRNAFLMYLALGVMAAFAGQAVAQSVTSGSSAIRGGTTPARAGHATPHSVHDAARRSHRRHRARRMSGLHGVARARRGAGANAMSVSEMLANQTTPAERQAAADQAAARGLELPAQPARLGGAPLDGAMTRTVAPIPGGVPDYFGSTPNYANSPLPTQVGGTVTGGIRKFVDALPTIPTAVPDTKTYPGADYYEIELRQYQAKMHQDLPVTNLRGYVQVNKGTDGANQNTINPAPIQSLGPMIVAHRDRPVRVKFTNKLATGPEGDLFLPVDTTVVGAGTGPNGGTELYKQNRATMHLHGGTTPWISDGTEHQWITPAGETDVVSEGRQRSQRARHGRPGARAQMTFFYTNQQSARLMFYHDHAYGITRLNVYAGEAGALRAG